MRKLLAGHWASVPDPWHFGIDSDPDLRTRSTDLRIWILLRILLKYAYSSVPRVYFIPQQVSQAGRWYFIKSLLQAPPKFHGFSFPTQSFWPNLLSYGIDLGGTTLLERNAPDIHSFKKIVRGVEKKRCSESFSNVNTVTAREMFQWVARSIQIEQLRKACGEVCRGADYLNRLARPLVRAPSSWSGGPEFESREGQILVRELKVAWLGVRYSPGQLY
jgi:hypothetical protein